METRFHWESIETDTTRAKVFGGWVVQSRWVGYKTDVNSMVFVQDQNYEWLTEQDSPFTWEAIDEETCRAKVPQGWIVRVRWLTFRSDVENMVVIPDPNHEWDFEKGSKLSWEIIEFDTDRTKVIGGWLVRGRWSALRTDVESMTYMLDPANQWVVPHAKPRKGSRP